MIYADAGRDFSKIHVKTSHFSDIMFELFQVDAHSLDS